jgi:hypothetical protein
MTAFEGWTIPPGYTPDNIGRCRSCDAAILWAITPRGKKSPLDPDGASHFGTCPTAEQWRKPK